MGNGWRARQNYEPGLILTPPATKSEEDDGYLPAPSEITGLTLDADWVILSACNTAAGGAVSREVLSDLDRIVRRRFSLRGITVIKAAKPSAAPS